MSWNKIEFKDWKRDIDFTWTSAGHSRTVNVLVSVSEAFESPVDLGLDDDDNGARVGVSMSPDEARELAAKLIEAADAADNAGRVA